MSTMYQFVMRSGPTAGTLYPLEGETVSIGRDASNTIQISDAEVSRRHARLLLQGGRYILEDLGSTNGTYVNGQRLTGPHVLKPGDVVSLGENIVLAFEAVEFDPGATVAVQRAAPPPPPRRSVAPPPAPAASYYAGQVPPGPATPGRSINPLPILIGVGALVFLCACVAFFWWVDSANLWCTFFPFLAGCP